VKKTKRAIVKSGYAVQDKIADAGVKAKADRYRQEAQAHPRSRPLQKGQQALHHTATPAK
jgi:hypothetical protein